MCGIFCCICHVNQKPHLEEELAELLRNRGPDNHCIIRNRNILFGGFVLWQQGISPSNQPISYKNWTLLLNGDIFNTNNQNDSSDTSWLIENLSTCTNDDDILFILKNLKGPYSMIIYNSESNNIYFARDPLGRNSLLIESDSTSIKILSNSILDKSGLEKICIELPPLGLFKLNAENPKMALLYPWKLSNNDNPQNDGLKILEEIFEVETSSKYIDPVWLLPSETNSNYFDFYQLCNSKMDPDTLYDCLSENKIVNESISQFLELLRSSVRERVSFTPNYCNDCIKSLKSHCNHSKIAILFSGGIDCTILAVIANEFVNSEDSIDLINVAFEASKAKDDINWDVPDRCSAKESLQELKQLCPSRKWNFVEVNVTRKELNEKLQSHIKHLIYPLNTVLDESLGCAFWFASRGEGHCDGEFYKSTARVVLIGSGADELFGGYTRHRNAYNRCTGSHDEKLENLSRELDMDWKRLPSRNLGRDDRVIADNKKTSRAPFIQEDITYFVRSLKPEQRCCFALEQGIGDKLFLRLSGFHLGLRSSIKLKKRAIQFGSRIANKNQNAKDLSIHIQ